MKKVNIFSNKNKKIKININQQFNFSRTKYYSKYINLRDTPTEMASKWEYEITKLSQVR